MADNTNLQKITSISAVEQDKLLQEEQISLRLSALRQSSKQENNQNETDIESRKIAESTNRELEESSKEEETTNEPKKLDPKNLKSLASEEGKKIEKKPGFKMAIRFLFTSPWGIAILLGILLFLLISIVLIAIIVMAKDCYDSYSLGKVGLAADVWWQGGIDKWFIKAMSGECK